MCLIKIFKDGEQPITVEGSVADFYEHNVHQVIQGYRFYDGDGVYEGSDITYDAERLLAAETVTFLRPSAGVALVPVLIGATVVGAVAAIAINALTPDIPEYQVQQHVDTTPNNVQREQRSSTNSLGQRENEPMSGRVDDIYGYVAGHVPKLMTRPRVYYENGDQYEEYDLMLSRGKLRVSEVYEGKTPFSNIPNANVAVYHTEGPDPNDQSVDIFHNTVDITSTPPQFRVGDPNFVGGEFLVNEEVDGFTTQELTPPNEFDVNASEWRFSGLEANGQITVLLEYSGTQNLTQSWSVGGFMDIDLVFRGSVRADRIHVRPLNSPWETTPTAIYDVTTYTLLFIRGSYQILEVTANTIKLDGTTGTTGSNVAWTDIWGFNPYETGFLASKIGPDGRLIDDLPFNHNLDDSNWLHFERDAISKGGGVWEYPPATNLSVNPYNPTVAIGSNITGSAGPYYIRKGGMLEFNIVSREGVYVRHTDTNKTESWNIKFRFRLHKVAANGQLETDTIYDSNVLSWENRPKLESHNRHELNTVGKTFRINAAQNQIDDAGGKAVALIIERITESESTSNTIQLVGRTVLERLSNQRTYDQHLGVVGTTNLHKFGDFTVAKVQLKNNQESRSIKRRRTTFDCTRLIPTYLRDQKRMNVNLHPVANVADVTIAMALDPYIGRMKLEDIDADTLQDVQDQLRIYYDSTVNPGHGSDYVVVGYCIDSVKLRFEQLFKMFWNVVNCEAYTQGRYKVYPTLSRPTSSKQFTHRYKIPGTDQRERGFVRSKDGIEVTYRSGTDGEFRILTAHIDESTTLTPTNPIRIELSGATNHMQAWIRMRRELNILRYQNVISRFEADGVARVTVPGERVDNVDLTMYPQRDGGYATENYVYDGEVIDVNGLEVTLSQPVKFKPVTSGSGEMTIRFSDENGVLGEAIRVDVLTGDNVVRLTQAPSFNLYTGYKQRKTTFTLAHSTDRDGMAVLVRELTPKTTGNGVKTRQITAVNYDERYFQDDKQWPGES